MKGQKGGPKVLDQRIDPGDGSQSGQTLRERGDALCKSINPVWEGGGECCGEGGG